MRIMINVVNITSTTSDFLSPRDKQINDPP